MNDTKLAVALTYTICPYCAEKAEGPIVMNTRLDKKTAKYVESMNGQATEWKPCDRCKGYADKGGVFFIEIDPEKSSNMANSKPKLSDVWRTGRLACIKREAYDRMFDQPPHNSMVFVDPEVSDKLGLFDQGEST